MSLTFLAVHGRHGMNVYFRFRSSAPAETDWGEAAVLKRVLSHTSTRSFLHRGRDAAQQSSAVPIQRLLAARFDFDWEFAT
jgi:hypothetical protein